MIYAPPPPKKKDISIYCLPRVGKEIQNRFNAFTEDKYPGAPSFEITEIETNHLL